MSADQVTYDPLFCVHVHTTHTSVRCKHGVMGYPYITGFSLNQPTVRLRTLPSHIIVILKTRIVQCSMLWACACPVIHTCMTSSAVTIKLVMCLNSILQFKTAVSTHPHDYRRSYSMDNLSTSPEDVTHDVVTGNLGWGNLRAWYKHASFRQGTVLVGLDMITWYIDSATGQLVRGNLINQL